jgi:hypothetical protein
MYFSFAEQWTKFCNPLNLAICRPGVRVRLREGGGAMWMIETGAEPPVR